MQKQDIPTAMTLLGIPPFYILDNNCRVSGEEAFLMALDRFAFPKRLTDMENTYGREYSQISRTINTVVRRVVHDHRHRLSNIGFFVEQFPTYHAAIIRKIREENNDVVPQREAGTVGFVDGWRVRICRPSELHPEDPEDIQRAAYDGHAAEHNLAYLILSFPDGMIGHRYGPVAGRNPDATLLRDSGFNALMRDCQEAAGMHYMAYLDNAFTTQSHCVAAYKGTAGHPLEQWQRDANTLMAKLRIGVEWAIGRVTEIYKFVDYFRGQKVQQNGVAEYVDFAMLMANMRTCFYGAQENTYFTTAPPAAASYFAV
jgi:hypothetical protein